MTRKWAGVVCTLALLLTMAVSADAAQTGGSLRIQLDTGELPVTNGAVMLYQVGEPSQDGYRIAEDFGGGLVKWEDADSYHLAQWLAESAGDLGRTVFLDVEGEATFSNLEAGLYLAVQTQWTDGFYPFRPFLTAIPQAQDWDLTVQPHIDPIVVDNPQTGQSIVPLLGAMGMVVSGMGLYFCFDSRRKK